MKKIHIPTVVWRTFFILVILVFLTTQLASFLAARFVSGTDANDSARVARWDYVLELDENYDLFGTAYDKDGNVLNVTADTDANSISVRAVGTGKIVTPNTSGSIVFKVTGTGSAEVTAKIWIYMSNNFTEPSITIDGTVYKPLKWSLTRENTDGTINTLIANKSLEDFYGEITGASSVVSKQLSSNTTVSEVYTITWEWPLESGNDEADTAFGEFVADITLGKTESEAYAELGDRYTDVVTTLSIDITAAVEQIN